MPVQVIMPRIMTQRQKKSSKIKHFRPFYNGFDPRYPHQNKDSSNNWNPFIFPFNAKKNRVEFLITKYKILYQILSLYTPIMPRIMTRNQPRNSFSRCSIDVSM